MNKKGFTLVELLAVIAILAILVLIAVPNVLSMFNKAKKDVFLTDAKNVYKEISKKYISESMKGNNISSISNDNNKLDMDTNDLKYNVKLDNKGNIIDFEVGNDNYCISGKFNNLGELTVDKVKNGKCESIPEIIPSFANDSWGIIVNNVKNGDIHNYNVGDTKEIDLGSYGKHTIRIANLSTPSECSTSGFSQTACGFVLEFQDIITTRVMNDTMTNDGGWPASSMRTFVNADIYNALPNDLKNGIIDTYVVSSRDTVSSSNFVSTDKLYFLETKEIYIDTLYGTVNDSTRTLDYYINNNVSINNYSGAIKNYGTSPAIWWTRSANNNGNFIFCHINKIGNYGSDIANAVNGISPAFRIG